MNAIFFAIVSIAFLVTAYHQIGWIPPAADAVSPMDALGAAMVEAAGGAVTLAIGLVGMMSLFLGLMKVAEAGGMLTIIAKTVRPLMVRAFPDVPPNHPAMGAMILNISANALGLGNAATPFGIRAMQELDTLNPHKGTASNAMALFLAINTSAVTLLPTGVIALRASAGSLDPAGILPTTLFATCISTTVAILAAKLYQRWSPIVPDPTPASPVADSPGAAATAAEVQELPGEAAEAAYPGWVSALALTGLFALIPLTVLYGRTIAPWVIPGLMMSLLTFGVARQVRIYEVLVEGARDGFQVAIRIIPYLVAILVAVAMLRASGALDVLVGWLSPATSLVGLPGEALPMALIRPLSGTGAFGVLASILQDPSIGPDSYIGYLVSTISGSTDTTFSELAVYFGAVQIRRVRHALAAGLTADVAGVAGSVIACRYLYGG
ncbi:MAG TPA: nucleoside recognition domain-containing protein [Methylomirabilota bacterium]|nr:nucleoside recognition domain-containing protein [Methylomirabilota bacterium]